MSQICSSSYSKTVKSNIFSIFQKRLSFRMCCQSGVKDDILNQISGHDNLINFNIRKYNKWCKSFTDKSCSIPNHFNSHAHKCPQFNFKNGLCNRVHTRDQSVLKPFWNSFGAAKIYFWSNKKFLKQQKFCFAIFSCSWLINLAIASCDWLTNFALFLIAIWRNSRF